MSKHSMRSGSASSPSASCSPSSASARCWRRRSAFSRSWSSASLRVALGEVEDPALVAALGHRAPRPRRAAQRQRLGELGPLAELALDDDLRRDRQRVGVVLQEELLDDVAEPAARPRWRGRTTGGRRARRRAPGRPGRWRRCRSTATATASSVPTASLATRWRSSSARTEFSRLRSSAAVSYSCASAAARIRASMSRSISR